MPEAVTRYLAASVESGQDHRKEPLLDDDSIVLAS
jgi:hypothetical protein